MTAWRSLRRSASAPVSIGLTETPVAETLASAAGLWTQSQAAEYLGVSCRYLRSTGCPRVELPGNGRKGRPVLRYKPSTVEAWAQSRGMR